MKRIQLLVNFGKYKAGWGIQVEDGLATALVSQGKAIFGASDLPLKKGNLQNYNNCQPLNPSEIAALSAPKAAVKPPQSAPVEEKAEKTA